jgi:hypothetical protein
MLGILYLAFQAFPVIFEEGYGFDIQSTGMSFLGIGLGMLLAISTQPFWNRYVVHPYLLVQGESWLTLLSNSQSIQARGGETRWPGPSRNTSHHGSGRWYPGPSWYAQFFFLVNNT